MINVSPAYVAILESDRLRPVYLVDLPNLRLTTHPAGVIWKGNTYGSSEIIIGLDGISNTSEIQSNTYRITLSNTNQLALSTFGNANYTGVPCVVYLALLNDDGELIQETDGTGPIEFYRGLFDGWEVSESETESTIDITLKSHWSAFERTAGRWTNQASQQEQYPTDTIFEYAHVEESDIKWGAKD